MLSLNSNSFRRDYLDACLAKNLIFFKGNVLDIGGKKKNYRGKFIPPFSQVDSWKYLNTDKNSEPDYYCDAEKIPLEDRVIDTIIMTEVLEYLPNPDKVFLEAHRVLKNNGHFLISTPLFNPIHGDHLEDRTRFTTIALKEMSILAGFEVQSIEAMGSVGAVIYDILRVATGYASKKEKSTVSGVLLRFFRPFFSLMDKTCKSQKNFINTGYFLILKKTPSLKPNFSKLL